MRKRVQTIMTVDDLTGEVTSQYSVYSSVKDGEQQYAKVYIGAEEDVFSRSRLESAILKYFLIHTSPSGDVYEVAVNAHVKRTLAERMECSTSNVDYAIRRLLSANLIGRISSGTYMLNPHVMGRGSWETIQRLRLVYDTMVKKKPAHD